jgi:DNA-binding MarR family transcriptional regulator
MKGSKGFSLSSYFNELNKKQDHKAQRASDQQSLTAVSSIEVLKALRASGRKLPLAALARAVNVKIGPCQDICDRLQGEDLIEIEPDQATGNDLIKITDKGMGLL